MFLRAGSWFSIAKAALPRAPLRRRDVTSATMVGVLMSATLPARLGEPARAMVLARRTGRMRETLPGAARDARLPDGAQHRRPGLPRRDHRQRHRPLPLELRAAVPLQPRAAAAAGRGRARADGRRAARGSGRVARADRRRSATRCVKVRRGLVVFRDPRRGPIAAAVAQLGAWALQLLACYALFTALGLDRPRSGSGPPRRSSSRSTSPRSSRRPRRTSASSSSRRSASSPRASASAPPTRSPTA